MNDPDQAAQRARLQTLPEHDWMASLIGESLADALWTHIDIAEAARLRAVFGYAKDNAFPPHLRVRLADPVFARHLVNSVRDEGVAELFDAVQQLLGRVDSEHS